MANHKHLDDEQLQRLLDEAMSDVDEGLAAEQVADCLICQQQLEALAARPDWWSEAAERLIKSSAEIGLRPIEQVGQSPKITAADYADLPHGEGTSKRQSFGHFGSNAPSELFDEAYASDFAVDFLEPSDDPGMLGRLGEYEILSVIGRGGMGVVLKGFQRELHRFVAVKVLSPHLATSGAARRRFAREAQATAAVVNPHVMAIHMVHAQAKLPYLVMPYIECESLQQRLDRSGPLELRDVLRIGMQAARGLAAAHAQGLVHRDVKPANILLETNVDRVMLTDFGLARAVDDATLTRTGIIAGTPQYMSPEQANGDDIDHRSDLFSLGSVLYAMCTARPPFRAETTFGVLRRIRETEPRPIREINSDIPAWIERIVTTLLSKYPSGRPSSATDIASLLEQCLAHVQQPTVVPLPDELTVSEISERKPRLIRSSSKNVAFAVAITALTLSVAAFASFIYRVTLKDTPRPGTANGISNDQTRELSSPAADVDSDDAWDQTQSDIDAATRIIKRLESQVASDPIEPQMNSETEQRGSHDQK